LARTCSKYSPGKKPSEIEASVARVATLAKSHIVPGDYHRFDGHQSRKSHQLNVLFRMAFFNPKYHDELLSCMEKTVNCTGYGKHGTKYTTEFKTNSGLMDTIDKNTIVNMFLAYVTFRRMGYTPQEAWAALGVYCGDDSLTADIDLVLYKQVSEEFNHVLEAESYTRGSADVTYLARVYDAAVWWGQTDNVCDIPRALSKIHATGSLPADITPKIKFTEKMRGYYHSDRNTPIFRDIFDAIDRISPGLMSSKTIDIGLDTYWADAGEDVQYKNTNCYDHFLAYFFRVMPTFDLTRLTAHTLKAKTIDELMQFPMCISTVVVIKTQGRDYCCNGVLYTQPVDVNLQSQKGPVPFSPSSPKGDDPSHVTTVITSPTKNALNNSTAHSATALSVAAATVGSLAPTVKVITPVVPLVGSTRPKSSNQSHASAHKKTNRQQRRATIHAGNIPTKY